MQLLLSTKHATLMHLNLTDLASFTLLAVRSGDVVKSL